MPSFLLVNVLYQLSIPSAPPYVSEVKSTSCPSAAEISDDKRSWR